MKPGLFGHHTPPPTSYTGPILVLPTGEQITVTVLGIKGNQVRIGTDAPDDISIVREELLEKLPAES